MHPVHQRLADNLLKVEPKFKRSSVGGNRERMDTINALVTNAKAHHPAQFVSAAEDKARCLAIDARQHAADIARYHAREKELRAKNR